MFFGWLGPELPEIFLEIIGSGKRSVDIQCFLKALGLIFVRIQILRVFQKQPSGPFEKFFVFLPGQLVEGSSGRMLVEVRLSPSAPFKRSRGYSTFTVTPFFYCGVVNKISTCLQNGWTKYLSVVSAFSKIPTRMRNKIHGNFTFWFAYGLL